MQERIVRYGRPEGPAKPHSSTHTHPGPIKKRTLRSSAVAYRNPDQHVHISASPIGFNIGAAGQPPTRPQLPAFAHRTAAGLLRLVEGRWRFFWGRYWRRGRSDAWKKGDIFNIPNRHFSRGFENIGTDYGMIMADPWRRTTPAAALMWAPSSDRGRG